MEIGKISESILKRSILKQIRHRRDEIIVGPNVGANCSIISLKEDEDFVITADPITGSVFDIGTLALHAAANDLAASGAEPVGIMLTILLPEKFPEGSLREIMKEIEQGCILLNMEIMGGHTEVTRAVNQPIISVTGIGKVKKGKVIKTSGAKIGQDVVVSKWVGLEGTSIIANIKEDELLTKYTPTFVEEAKNLIQYISVIEESKIALNYEVTSMHDVTEGGIYAALWEVAAASNVGMEVELNKLPIRLETVEICEHFDLNPYKLISSGCLVMTTNKGWELVKELESKGIKATIVGKITKGKERVVLSEDERKYLEPAKSDELYKIY
ncbi:MAG: hypothetical protein K0R15_1996 [Clostridiales bacterium]|jgi:thiamin-phosphate kinase|nr:hypothetical protein [Clostridiales bacterium]